MNSSFKLVSKRFLLQMNHMKQWLHQEIGWPFSTCRSFLMPLQQTTLFNNLTLPYRDFPYFFIDVFKVVIWRCVKPRKGLQLLGEKVYYPTVANQPHLFFSGSVNILIINLILFRWYISVLLVSFTIIKWARSYKIWPLEVFTLSD